MWVKVKDAAGKRQVGSSKMEGMKQRVCLQEACVSGVCCTMSMYVPRSRAS